MVLGPKLRTSYASELVQEKKMAEEIIPAAQDVLTVQRKLRPSRQLSLRWRSWRRLRAGDIFAYL